MELLVITSPEEVPDEQRVVSTMFAKGLTRLHLRKPHYQEAQLRAWIEAVAPEHRRKLVIHSHYSLCKEYSLGGLHLTAEARGAAREDVDALLTTRPSLSLSTSFHAIAELQQNTASYCYVFLSPIYDSISKPQLQQAYRKHELEVLLSQVSIPVVALGGVSLERVAEVAALGFFGAAVLGAIWKSPDPVSAFCELYNENKNCSDAIEKGLVEKCFSISP